jgi:hypothetical protein
MSLILRSLIGARTGGGPIHLRASGPAPRTGDSAALPRTTVPLGSARFRSLHDRFGRLLASPPRPAQARPIPRRLPPLRVPPHSPSTPHCRALLRIETHGLRAPGRSESPQFARISRNPLAFLPAGRAGPPAWVTGPFLVDTAVAFRVAASARAKLGLGQHGAPEVSESYPGRGGNAPSATPSIALTETYAMPVVSSPRSAPTRRPPGVDPPPGRGWPRPAPTAPDSTLQSGSLRAIPIPTPDPRARLRKNAPHKGAAHRISFDVGLLLCGFCFVAFDFFLQWSG